MKKISAPDTPVPFPSLRQAWLRASGFWWDEEAVELGAVMNASAVGSLPRVGVRALRRLEVGASPSPPPYLSRALVVTPQRRARTLPKLPQPQAR